MTNDLTTPSVSSVRLPTDSALAAKHRRYIGVELTPLFLAQQMQRLGAMFGRPKDRTDEQIALMAREWFEALKPFGSVVVAGAISNAIETHDAGYWPPLASLVAWSRNEQQGWLSALGLGADGSLQAHERPPSDAYRAWRARDRAENGPPPGGYPGGGDAERTSAMSEPQEEEPAKGLQPMGPPSPALKEALERRRINALREAELRREAAIPTDELPEG